MDLTASTRRERKQDEKSGFAGSEPKQPYQIKQLTSFVSKANSPLIVILGPSASGKTAISLEIARRINGEIISTDSCQIYKEMDIATDLLSPKDQQDIPHHLLGFADPDQTITLAEYKEMAEQKIKEIYERGAVPMLVGGTGLYISAIIENYDIPACAPDEKLRKELQEKAKKEGPEALHERLAKLDPQSAATIHPNNIRYVIRALEINLSGLKKQDKKAKKSPYDLYLLGITRPREEIYQRIGKRVDEQVERGLIDEVKALLEKGYSPDLPSMQSLGVKEIIPYIKGEKTLEQCLEILKMNTRRYAKRQITWLKRYQDVNWISSEEIEKIIKS